MGGAQEKISSSSTPETLQSAALHRAGQRETAGFMSGSNSTTWGRVDSIDLVLVLYGPLAAGTVAACHRRQRCRWLAAISCVQWRLMVSSSDCAARRAAETLRGSGGELVPHRSRVLYDPEILESAKMQHVMWTLCVLGMLPDIPGTHVVRGTRRYSRYGRRLQPLHKKSGPCLLEG